jgi:hypothetical protein
MKMQGFVFIYILLIIFFIIGVIIIWRLNKKIFQIIAENPEKLANFSFDYASKLGIKTATGIKKFWESVVGKKIVDFGIIERRPYGKKYFIETRAFLCENQGQKHLTLQVVETFDQPGIVEYTLGSPKVNWYILRPPACKLLNGILGKNEDKFMARYYSKKQNQVFEPEEKRSSWLEMQDKFLKFIGITNMREISLIDYVERIIFYDQSKQDRWIYRITAYTAKEYGEPLLVLKFEGKLISVQRFLGFIPKGIVQQNYMYPFGKQGRNGLRKTMQYLNKKITKE